MPPASATQPPPSSGARTAAIEPYSTSLPGSSNRAMRSRAVSLPVWCTCAAGPGRAASSWAALAAARAWVRSASTSVLRSLSCATATALSGVDGVLLGGRQRPGDPGQHGDDAGPGLLGQHHVVEGVGPARPHPGGDVPHLLGIAVADGP